MNQQELEARLMSKPEFDLIKGIKTMVSNHMSNLIETAMESHADELDFDNKAEAAVRDAIDDALDDIEAKINEHIDTERVAEKSVHQAIGEYNFTNPVTKAIRELIAAEVLDSRIWLPGRRVSWWRRVLHFVGGMAAPG